MTAEQSSPGLAEARTCLDDILGLDDLDEIVDQLDRLRKCDWFDRAPADGARLLADRLEGRAGRTLPPEFWFFAANLYLRAGESWACREALDHGLAFEDEVEDGLDLARAYRTLGVLEATLNDWERAVTAWEESLMLLPPGDAGELDLLRDLGHGWEALGAADRAMVRFQEALKLAARNGSIDDECELLGLLGRHCQSRGDFGEAASYYLYGLRRAREVGHRIGEAGVEIGFGGLCLEMGELDDAVRHLERGVATARELEDRLLQVTALERLAEVARRSGDSDRARSLLEEAVFLAKGGGSHAALASLYHMLAMLHEGSGKTSLALAAYEKAVDERREANDQAGLGATLTNLGALYQQRNDPETAKRFYREAILAFNDSGRDRREVRIVLENLRRLEEAFGDADTRSPAGASGHGPRPAAPESYPGSSDTRAQSS